MSRPQLPDRPVDQEQDRKSLEGGGIPLRAQRRIQELHAAERPIFTSNLSPAETVVCRQNGIESVAQVMGSSVYHVGWSTYASYAGGELTNLTHAYGAARQLALSRMQQEAMMLRAHAVIGVVVTQRGHAWGGETIEFTAMGTAVRIAGMALPRFPPLSLLGADELYKLHGAGYWPVGVAIGNCFWYEPHADCLSEGTFWSSSLPTHTRAAHEARTLSVQRFHDFSRRLGAHGVVGVKVHRRGRDAEYERNDRSHTAFTLEIMLMGTAVARTAEARPAPPRPLLMIDLRDLPRPKQSGAVAHGHG